MTSVDEEVVLLEEQLRAAQADIDRLQGRLAEAEARASARDAEVIEMKRQLTAANGALADKESAAETYAAEAAAMRSRLEEAAARSRSDAQRYRDLVLAHEPDLPADLVSGDSIDALEQSLQQARQTVAQVRQHLEQQAQSLRVPSGAPVRSAPDTSDLSPAEKIRSGLINK